MRSVMKPRGLMRPSESDSCLLDWSLKSPDSSATYYSCDKQELQTSAREPIIAVTDLHTSRQFGHVLLKPSTSVSHQSTSEVVFSPWYEEHSQSRSNKHWMTWGRGCHRMLSSWITWFSPRLWRWNLRISTTPQVSNSGPQAKFGPQHHDIWHWYLIHAELDCWCYKAHVLLMLQIPESSADIVADY